MEKRFYSGAEIRDRWGISPQLLLDGIKDGRLTPYLPDGSRRVIDMQIHATLAPFSDGKSDTCTRQSAKPLKVNLNNILGFIYPGNEVEGFLESGKDETVTDGDAQKQPEQSVKILDTTKTSNYFRREDGFWRIGYKGESATVKDIGGIRYITLLLERRGDALSCIELYQAVSGQRIDYSASKRMAADEDLGTSFSRQDVSSQEARDAYLKRHMQLEDELLKINDLPDHERNPEDEFRKKEIEEEMAKLEPHLKERAVFVDPNNKKAQTNIKRRLDEAYKAIRRHGMKKLATHLEDHIKPDGAYGLQYVGSVAWDISS